jgi:hypothetical protein
MSEALDRAGKATRLLQDPLYVEAYDKVKLALLTAFEASPARDTEGREQIFQRLKALNDVRGYFEQAVSGGKIAIDLKEKRRLFGLGR